MKTDSRWLIASIVTLVAACGSRTRPGNQEASRAGLQARMKAATTVTTTATETATASANLTGTATGTLTATVYYVSPATSSRTVTSTFFTNDGGTVVGTASGTATATYISGTRTVSGTTTATETVSAWVRGVGTNTLTVWANQTTASLTVLRTSTVTGTETGTITYAETHTASSTDTATSTGTVVDGGATDAPPDVVPPPDGATAASTFSFSLMAPKGPPSGSKPNGCVRLDPYRRWQPCRRPWRFGSRGRERRLASWRQFNSTHRA